MKIVIEIQFATSQKKKSSVGKSGERACNESK
jgi:hypothetical protein